MSALSFIQQGFLWALAAISIPIIIHFIHRRKAIRWRFAAMEFLLRSHHRVARRLRIKQLLLLLLRCLMFAALALIFAKPFLRQAKGTSPVIPQAIVLIVDDSFSMQYKPKGASRSLFDRARKQAKTLLERLRGEDQVALLRGSQSRQSLPHEHPDLTYDKRAVIRLLDRWKPSYRNTDLLNALQRANSLLAKIKGLSPRIVLISDFARHAFEAVQQTSIPGLPNVDMIPVRPKSDPTNYAITNVDVSPAPFASPDAYRFVVTIRSFGRNKRSVERPIQLFLNGQARARGTVKLPPKGLVEKRFTVQLPRAGLYTGYAQLAPDPLKADNRFYFTLQARQRPKVLLLNGEHNDTPYSDEIFYVEKALRNLQSTFIIQSRIASASLPDPKGYQVIFLANVGQLPSDWIGKLQMFVRNGGGLFISMGSQINPESYNVHLANLLPRPLRRTALAAQRPDGTGITIQRYFGEVQGAHPVFRPLYRDGLVFQTARVSKLMLVQTRNTKERGQVLWRYSHGPPALLERKIGKGRVLLLTTSIDRDWTDLPIRPFFRPWLQCVTTYLAGGARFQRGKSTNIGESTRLNLPGNAPVRLSPPHGPAQWLRPSGNTFRLRDPQLPGLYRFSRGGKPLPVLPKAVNINPQESDITPWPTKQFKRTSLNLRQSTRLWPYLIFLLCLFFVSEALVLRFL